MPLYEYECDACGGRFEVIQKFSETATECRRCGKGPVRRLVAAPAFQFKGTGWYVTDYAQKGKSGGESESRGKPTPVDKSESKTESATDTAKKTDTAPSTTTTTTTSTSKE
jgi:putative FmdB family regulatory protein